MSSTSTHNFFNKINKWADGSFAIMPFLAFLGLFVIGCILFAEDTISSYTGVKMFEDAYNLKAATWDATYWAYSLIPQFAQIAFFYVFLIDTKKHRHFLALAFVAVLIDLFLDGLYRSNGYLGDYERAGAIGINTLIVSMTSEAFISFSVGFLLVMTKPLLERSGIAGRFRTQRPSRSRHIPPVDLSDFGLESER